MTDEQEVEATTETEAETETETATEQPAKKKGKKKIKKTILLLCDAIECCTLQDSSRIMMLEKVRELNS